MFTEKNETKLEILEDGKVNVTIIKYYFRDGHEIGRDNWGCCLEPHPAYLEYASQFLSEYYMNIIKQAWTDEVMTSYQTKYYNK